MRQFWTLIHECDTSDRTTIITTTTMRLTYAITLIFLLGSEAFPTRYRKHHRHQRTHNRLNKELQRNHCIENYLQKEEELQTVEDARDLKAFTGVFFEDLKKDEFRIRPSTFISLMEREQIFDKDDYRFIAKLMRKNHIKAIEDQHMFAALLSLTRLLLEKKEEAANCDDMPLGNGNVIDEMKSKTGEVQLMN